MSDDLETPHDGLKWWVAGCSLDGTHVRDLEDALGLEQGPDPKFPTAMNASPIPGRIEISISSDLDEPASGWPQKITIGWDAGDEEFAEKAIAETTSILNATGAEWEILEDDLRLEE